MKYIIIFIIGFFLTGFCMADSKKESVCKLKGEFLKAWNICYSDFNKIADLSDKEKNLNNYDVFFMENKECFVIELIPHLLSDEMAEILNKITLGRSTKYWVDKTDYQIKKRIFYKD